MNNKGSAASKASAKSITFSDAVVARIKRVLRSYNKANPNAKITLTTAKAVMRRGMGAYSVSHRPTISNGRPNSRVAWATARLYAFMRLKSKSETANGVVTYSRIKKTYNQDNDLL